MGEAEEGTKEEAEKFFFGFPAMSMTVKGLI
jgi:hypothetical protein